MQSDINVGCCPILRVLRERVGILERGCYEISDLDFPPTRANAGSRSQDKRDTANHSYRSRRPNLSRL
jgi:hypothetical protein